MSNSSRFTVQCFVCRQVRTEQDEWADRPPPPGGRTSHGICGPCLAAHYPDVDRPLNRADRPAARPEAA